MKKLVLIVALLLVVVSISQAQTPARVTLQSAATTGNGTIANASGYTIIGLQIVENSSGDRVVNFETTVDGTNYKALTCKNITANTNITTIAASGVVTCSIGGFSKFRARVSGGTTGTVSVYGLMLQNASGGGGGGGSTFADSDLNGSHTFTGVYTFSPSTTLGTSGVSTIIGSAQTITLSGVDPTTYATIDGYKLNSPTLAGTNPNQTVTLGATLTVVGPIKGANVTAITLAALNIPTWVCSTATTCVGGIFNAPTGGVSNYAAVFNGGNVGINTTAPLRALHVVETSDGALTVPLVLQNSSVTTGAEIALDFATSTVASSVGVQISALRTAGGPTADLILRTANAGSLTEKIRIKGAGDIILSSASVTPATTGVRYLCLDTAGKLSSGTACVGT